MTGELPCPSCGAPVPVRSAALPYVTCGYCQTLIRRQGEGMEAVGKSAVLPFDVSPLQLGSTGSFGAVRFSVVGRVRWGWADGAWNEWLCDCSDGIPRWLSEAMGAFMLTEEHPELLDRPELKTIRTGIEPPEAGVEPCRTGQHRRFAAHHDAPRRMPPGGQQGGEIAAADVLGQGGDDVALDFRSEWDRKFHAMLSPRNARQF